MKTTSLVSVLVLLAVPLTVWSQSLQCLQEVKSSVEDPHGALQSWIFPTDGENDAAAICGFAGVGCYHLFDGNVLTLTLAGLGLKGSFPRGFNNCKSLTTLDLSNNEFTGPISATLCSDVPNLVSVVMSHNQLGGSVPDNLGQCFYLNFLSLEFNDLTGSLPASIGELSRLHSFNVSHNSLSGEVPSTFSPSQFNASGFSDNQMCGGLLGTVCNPPGKKGTNVGLVVGIAIGAVVAVLALLGILTWWWLSSRPVGYYSRSARDDNLWIKRIKAPRSIIVSMFEKPLVKIKLADLMQATDDFSQRKVIQTGRTGAVYKGILPDGSAVAIKRLQITPHTDRQFRAEMETLGRLKHRNLVPLLGFCIAGQERLLVYKHMPNGTLFDHLRGGLPLNSEDSAIDYGLTVIGTERDAIADLKSTENKLGWAIRVKIAIGAARGLAFLHHSCNPRVIHRNVTANSILLDDEFESRISDFGLARLMNPVDTHISTFVNGDFGDVGYVAPEYVRTLVATVKGDVYSFGVVLLELVTGQKPVDITEDNFRGNLAEWILYLSNAGKLSNAIDKSFLGKGYDDELMQFLKVASTCIVVTPKDRPSMYEVFHMLRSIGQKYQFSDENDEILLASDTGDVGGHDIFVTTS